LLEDYLYIDRARVRSYAEQIGAAVATDKRPQWKVGLALTGPSVEGEQSATVRPANDFEMITAIVASLKKEDQLLTERPASDQEAAGVGTGFILETMKARKVIFRCDPKVAPGGLTEIGVWVSNPIEKPSGIDEEYDQYEPRGMFVYLLEGYWDNESVQRAMSMYTALNFVLSSLSSVGVESRPVETSRDDYASPIAILERAGGIRGETRTIKSLYRVRSVSNNKIVNIGGRTLRCYDLFGYPIFIAAG
jgi:hypothetical protein